MTYMGGKQRLAKFIVPILNKYIKENGIENFYDVMGGGMNIISHVECENLYGNDLSPTLIALHEMAQKDFSLINTDSSREQWDRCYEEYKRLKAINFKDEPKIPYAEIGAIEWLGGFSGKGFSGGYGVNSKGRNQFKERYENLKKQSEQPIYQKIHFSCGDYRDLKIKPNSLVYCFDKDTEIMTKDGWKYLKDVNIKEDTFLSREPTTKKLDYLKATDYINYHYQGQMIHYTGRQIDFCVTPEHKIFFNKKYGKNKILMDCFLPAKEFILKSENCRFIKAGGIWSGKNAEEFDLCGDKVSFNKFCYLLGIFITDGCINNQDNITISQSKKEIVQKIEESLKELNLNYSKHSYRENSIQFYLSRKYIPFFKQFYLKEKRRIPEIFKNASKEAITNLIEGIIDGDGDLLERRKIYCPSYYLASDIQECLYKIGLASNISEKKSDNRYYKKEDRVIHGNKTIYIISILKTEYPPFYKKNVTFEDYNDMVYCITLEKWHTVLIKHNGKTVWLGQCDSPYRGTTTYGINTKFSYVDYYKWLINTAKTIPIFISEQKLPIEIPAKIVWEKEVKRDLSPKKKKEPVSEKLYFLDLRGE